MHNPMTGKAGVILSCEKKDPGTDSTANVYKMRRFFDSANAQNDRAFHCVF